MEFAVARSGAAGRRSGPAGGDCRSRSAASSATPTPASHPLVSALSGSHVEAEDRCGPCCAFLQILHTQPVPATPLTGDMEGVLSCDDLIWH